MVDIFENLDYIIEIFGEEKKLFLDNRNLLEKESKRLEALRPTYMKFNELYNRFRENINDIIAANSDLKEIKRMHSRGEIMEERFIMTNNRLKARIQDSYTIITEDIFPDLKELAGKVSIGSVPEEKKKEFEREKSIEIQKTEEEIKGESVVNQIMPYLKQVFPALIKKAVTYTTGIPIP